MPDSKSSVTESSSASLSAISSLKFPFKLTKDQIEAVDAWITNGCRGSIIYSTGTGKTEIAFECAKRAGGFLYSSFHPFSYSKYGERAKDLIRIYPSALVSGYTLTLSNDWSALVMLPSGG